MSIIVNGREYRTLAQPIFLGATQVLEAYCNGVKVYPDKWPVAIKIIKPPDKTDYVAGEEIDYTGIVVQLLDGDGEVYRDFRYPDGIVPFEELEFPVEKASGELTPVPGTYNVLTSTTFIHSGEYPYRGRQYVFIVTTSDVRSVFFWDGNENASNQHYYLFSDSQDAKYAWNYTINDPTAPQMEPLTPLDYFRTINGVNYYCAINGNAQGNPPIRFNPSINVVNVGVNDFELAFRYAYGDLAKESGYEIPVNWRSRYEDRTLTDAFEITIENFTNSGGGDF